MSVDPTDHAAIGLATRSEVMGRDYVERSLKSISEFRRPLLELVTRYGWGDVWTRAGLGLRDRSLITVAASAAMRHQDELRAHVRGALRLGVTAEELRELLLQVAVYCGVPTAAEAFGTVEAVVAELGDSAGRSSSPYATATTVNTKIVLLFAAANRGRTTELRDALRGEADRIGATLAPPMSARAGIGLDAEQVGTALTALGDDGRADFGAPGYDGLLWVTGPGGYLAELVEAVAGVAGRLRGLIDPAGSAAVAGTEETFLPGGGQLAGMYAIRRRPGDPVEHFHDFWRLEHTKLSIHIPGFRYRQLHGVGYANEQAAASAGIGVTDVDGIVEYFFDDIAYQVEMTRLPNFGEIYADEKNFIDHDRSTFSYVDLS